MLTLDTEILLSKDKNVSETETKLKIKPDKKTDFFNQNPCLCMGIGHVILFIFLFGMFVFRKIDIHYVVMGSLFLIITYFLILLLVYLFPPKIN